MINKTNRPNLADDKVTSIKIPMLKNHQGPNWLPLFAALMLCVVSSLPVIVLGKRFPLDLPDIFNLGTNFSVKIWWIVSPYNGTGRYFPFYWIFHGLEFQLFRMHVSPYFLVLALIYLSTCLLCQKLLQKTSGKKGWGVFLIFLLYLNTPLAENINTIGKAEPITLFFMIAICWSFFRYHIDQIKSSGATAVVTIIFFSLALWTKETATVLIGFALTGMVVSIIVFKVTKLEYLRGIAKNYGNLFILLLAGLLLSKIPYFIFPKTKISVTYTEYQITFKLLTDNLTFYLTQQPDVFVIGVLALGLVASRFRLTAESYFDKSELHVRSDIYIASLCVTGWAYYLALLIWRWPMGYYMLIPSVLFRLCVVYGICTADFSKRFGWLKSGVVCILLVTSTIYSFAYSYYITASQIQYSRMYSEAYDFYKSKIDENKSLIIESYPFYAEQVGGTELFLALDKHSVINGGNVALPVPRRVKGIADLLDPSVLNPELTKILNVSNSDIEKNSKNMPSHGDYLLIFTGNKLATWFLRGVAPFYNQGSLLKSEGVYQMDLVSEDAMSSWAIYVNTWTKMLDWGRTSLGYKLYRIKNDGPKFMWTGRYPDGWMSNKATLALSSRSSEPVIVKMSTPYFSVPNQVVITKDGKSFRVVNLTNTNETTVALQSATSSPSRFDFYVAKSASPKSLGINDDQRRLGIRINLDNKSNGS